MDMDSAQVVTAQRFRCVTRDIVQLNTGMTLGVGGGRFDPSFILSLFVFLTPPPSRRRRRRRCRRRLYRCL